MTDRASLVDLAALLLSRHAPSNWPRGVDEPAFLAAAADEGVLGLLEYQRRTNGRLAALPPSLSDRLRDAARRQAVVELVQRAELQRVVRSFADAGVVALLMKGASLAYALYPDPACRPRADTDILVRERDLGPIGASLARLGYGEELESGGRLRTSQRHHLRADPGGIRHACDVHWKVCIPHRFADLLRFDELEAAALPLPVLGPARGLGAAHALLLACVHRVAHHYDDRDRLLWLYDIHLLVEALTGEEVRMVIALAEREAVAAICERGVLLARARFDTRVPDEMLAGLRPGRREPSVAFLRDDLRLVDVLREDWRALPGWRAKLQLLLEHLFPPATYMRQRYTQHAAWPVAALYVMRIVSGAPKWLRSLGRPR